MRKLFPGLFRARAQLHGCGEPSCCSNPLTAHEKRLLIQTGRRDCFRRRHRRPGQPESRLAAGRKHRERCGSHRQSHGVIDRRRIPRVTPARDLDVFERQILQLDAMCTLPRQRHLSHEGRCPGNCGVCEHARSLKLRGGNGRAMHPTNGDLRAPMLASLSKLKLLVSPVFEPRMGSMPD